MIRPHSGCLRYCASIADECECVTGVVGHFRFQLLGFGSFRVWHDAGRLDTGCRNRLRSSSSPTKRCVTFEVRPVVLLSRSLADDSLHVGAHRPRGKLHRNFGQDKFKLTLHGRHLGPEEEKLVGEGHYSPAEMLEARAGALTIVNSAADNIPFFLRMI